MQREAQVTITETVLSALEAVVRTNQVRHDLDLELFDLELLDSLGTVLAAAR
jgi:hypothetical protein